MRGTMPETTRETESGTTDRSKLSVCAREYECRYECRGGGSGAMNGGAAAVIPRNGL